MTPSQRKRILQATTGPAERFVMFLIVIAIGLSAAFALAACNPGAAGSSVQDGQMLERVFVRDLKTGACVEVFGWQDKVRFRAVDETNCSR